jgi:hypothetical protein
MYSSRDNRPLRRLGFPIRTSPDQRLLSGFPELIAASHVLHRLLAPRHPPCALSSLTTTIRATTLEHSSAYYRDRTICSFQRTTRGAHPAPPTGRPFLASSPRARSSFIEMRFRQAAQAASRKPTLVRVRGMELKGVEPSTSGLQNRRSPN